MDIETKFRSLPLSETAWKKAKECADRTKPRSSRPAWIENAIHEQAKREVQDDHGTN
jgi:hypothetical protein